MSRPDPREFTARVLRQEPQSEHLLRLVLTRPDGWQTTGLGDEWISLTVPDQFQTRYYSVLAVSSAELVIDVVRHDQGLVSDWVQGDVVGAEVAISAPKGSASIPADARWVVLVGDLTALPAMTRIASAVDVPLRAFVESQDGPLPAYLPEATWLDPPAAEVSGLADFVASLQWPEGPGYFWMAGESAQMRAIRRHVRTLGWASDRYDLMGYWSTTRGARSSHD